jgi:hypothetical protein
MPNKTFDRIMSLLTDAMFHLLKHRVEEAYNSLRSAIGEFEDAQLRARKAGNRYA